jgi:hypothetical protein
MKKTVSIILFILVSLFKSQISKGQIHNNRVDFQTWTDITLTYFKSQKFSFGGDAGLRGIVSSKDWNLFYIRPAIHYSFTPTFKLSGGVGSFNTFNKTLSNISEIRIFQDAHISWPDIGWVDFYHRLRLEERFFFYQSLENEVSLRGRYLIRARTMNFKFIGQKKMYYIKAMWEAFLPIGESATELFIHNQRWYAALGFQPSNRMRYEIFYIWQKSREFKDDGFSTSENILRIRFFYTLKLPDQE